MIMDYKSDRYKNKIERPTKSDYKLFFVYNNGEVIRTKNTPHDIICFAQEQFEYTGDNIRGAVAAIEKKKFLVQSIDVLDEYNEMVRKYHDEGQAAYDRWMTDLKEEYGIDFQNDSVGKIIFDMAWERGHSCGLEEVDNCIDEQIDFVKQIARALKTSKHKFD